MYSGAHEDNIVTRGAEKMDQSMKCLPRKAKDPSSEPSTQVKIWANTCNPRGEEVVIG